MIVRWPESKSKSKQTAAGEAKNCLELLVGTLSEVEGRKNLSHSSQKSGAPAPLSDRIFPALSGPKGSH